MWDHREQVLLVRITRSRGSRRMDFEFGPPVRIGTERKVWEPSSSKGWLVRRETTGFRVRGTFVEQLRQRGRLRVCLGLRPERALT